MAASFSFKVSILVGSSADGDSPLLTFVYAGFVSWLPEQFRNPSGYIVGWSLCFHLQGQPMLGTYFLTHSPSNSTHLIHGPRTRLQWPRVWGKVSTTKAHGFPYFQWCNRSSIHNSLAFPGESSPVDNGHMSSKKAKNMKLTKQTNKPRSSSREVRIRVLFSFSVVYFVGDPSPKKGRDGHDWGT